MREFFKKYWQYLLNIYLFCSFAVWGIWQSYQYIVKGQLGYVELSFTIQSLVMAIVFLIRKPHQTVDTNPWHQVVAALAFLSGAGFMGQAPTGGPMIRAISRAIIFLASTFGIVTLLNLGRSFGIFIALRQVKANGVYSIVRHPMYAMDILLRTGFLISHLSAVTIIVFLGSTTCYVLRALLEERFLSRQPEYQEYMQRVKYRFIPALF